MYFDSFEAFISMGGHGTYVWLCYAVAILVIAALFSQPIIKKRQFLKQQLQVLKRDLRDEGEA